MIIKPDLAICLVIPQRWQHFINYIKPVFENAFGINVRPFLALPYENPFEAMRECWYNSKRLDYTIDDNELPPYLQGSTNYATWHKNPGCYNAFKAHQKMLSIADEMNVEEVLMLEDDIIVEDLDISQIEVPEYDMLYLGNYSMNQLGNEEVIPGVWRSYTGCGGFHGVLIKRKIYKKIIHFPCWGPYDWVCQKFIHPIHNVYGLYPCLINQKSGWSYVENQYLEK